MADSRCVTQWLCRVADRVFDVPPRAFVPPPKVTSTVVRSCRCRGPRATCGLPALERVTAAAFGQRRKMLRQSLKSLGGDPAPLLAAAVDRAHARAEELSVEQFAALAAAMPQRAAG